MKDKEIFIGPCSKYIDKQGWTTEIPVKMIEDKGYHKLTENEMILSTKELSKIIKQTKETEKNYYKRVVIPKERKETTEKLTRELKRKLDSLKCIYEEELTVTKDIALVVLNSIYTNLEEVIKELQKDD